MTRRTSGAPAGPGARTSRRTTGLLPAIDDIICETYPRDSARFVGDRPGRNSCSINGTSAGSTRWRVDMICSFKRLGLIFCSKPLGLRAQRAGVTIAVRLAGGVGDAHLRYERAVVLSEIGEHLFGAGLL